MTTLKQYENNRYSRILGYGASRGEVIVHNNDIVEAINSSDEWIKQRTGISTRHRASENQTVNDLAIAAAHDALANSHVTGEQIDAVIISTISHPYATPSLAVLVADAIGSRCPAYDISAACAGFCYGIAQADAMVRSGMAQNVLVIGVEKLSDFIDIRNVLSHSCWEMERVRLLSAYRTNPASPRLFGGQTALVGDCRNDPFPPRYP